MSISPPTYRVAATIITVFAVAASLLVPAANAAPRPPGPCSSPSILACPTPTPTPPPPTVTLLGNISGPTSVLYNQYVPYHVSVVNLSAAPVSNVETLFKPTWGNTILGLGISDWSCAVPDGNPSLGLDCTSPAIANTDGYDVLIAFLARGCGDFTLTLDPHNVLPSAKNLYNSTVTVCVS